MTDSFGSLVATAIVVAVLVAYAIWADHVLSNRRDELIDAEALGWLDPD